MKNPRTALFLLRSCLPVLMAATTIAAINGCKKARFEFVRTNTGQGENSTTPQMSPAGNEDPDGRNADDPSATADRPFAIGGPSEGNRNEPMDFTGQNCTDPDGVDWEVYGDDEAEINRLSDDQARITFRNTGEHRVRALCGDAQAGLIINIVDGPGGGDSNDGSGGNQNHHNQNN